MTALFHKMRLITRCTIWCSVLFCVIQISGCWSFEDLPRKIRVRINGNEIQCDGCLEFGKQIELDGEYLFIAEAATIFIFQANGGSWVKVHEIKYDVSTSELLDFAVTSSFLAVGVRDLDGARVDLYTSTSEGSWIIVEKINVDYDDIEFGRSIHIVNDRMIIGAPDFLYSVEGTNLDYGQAYIYRFENKKWELEAILRSSEGAINDHFGHSVRLVGDFAVVTRDLRDGPIEVFKWNGSEWVFHKYLEDSKGLTLASAANELLIAGDSLSAFTVDPGTQEFIRRAIEHDGEYFPDEVFKNDPFGAAHSDTKEHVKMFGNHAIVSAYFGKAILLRLIYNKWVVRREFEFEFDNRSIADGIAVSDNYVAIQSAPWKVEVFPN